MRVFPERVIVLGRARLTARSGSASATIDVTVIANPVKTLSVAPRPSRARTGDVVHFSANGRNWARDGEALLDLGAGDRRLIVARVRCD